MLLDILFVHPNASDKIYQSLSKDHSAIEPPIWAAMLANHCRSRGYSVSILDCEAERLDYDSSVKAIEDSKARLVCFVVYGQQPSASTQNMEGAVGTARLLKEINPNTNTITVGEKMSLFKSKCKVNNLNWLINEPKFPYNILCQIRYNGQKSKAVIKKESNEFTVNFSEPQLAITPGQSIVFYSDDVLTGGGIIEL